MARPASLVKKRVILSEAQSAQSKDAPKALSPSKRTKDGSLREPPLKNVSS